MLRRILNTKIGLTTLLIVILTFGWTLPSWAEKPTDVNLLSTTNRCPWCDLSGADFSRSTKLSHATLIGADLSRANLSESDLSQANLTDVNLSHANLRGVRLQGANLSNANLSGAELSGADLSQTNLTNADLVMANLSGANLKAAKFIGFSGAANLSFANLSGANLQSVNLQNTSLVDANLSNGDLSDADLRGVKLNGANLSKAKLSGARLTDAHLSHVNLQETKLNGSDLSRVTLTKADLTGADLTDIVLTNAILSGATGLEPYAQQMLKKASAQAAVGEFLVAVDYLKQIPEQTIAYTEAKSKISEYESQQRLKEQREVEGNQLLQDADKAAKSGDFDTAIRFLRKIPVDTKPYDKAQGKIRNYTEKQRQKVEAERAAEVSALVEAEKDRLFLQKFAQYLPEEIKGLYAGIPDSSKIEAARFACESFKRGVQLKELNLLGMKLKSLADPDSQYLRALAEAGREAYCP